MKPYELSNSGEPITRQDFVTACELQGLDADAFEAAASDDIVAGHLSLPPAARFAADSSGQAVAPPAYWAWLISLLPYNEAPPALEVPPARTVSQGKGTSMNSSEPPEVRFHVFTEGDATVGKSGKSAEVTFHQQVSPREIETIKEALQSAFEDVWDDDVKVYTQAEMAEDALAGADE